jgi:hypothetical protein
VKCVVVVLNPATAALEGGPSVSARRYLFWEDPSL